MNAMCIALVSLMLLMATPAKAICLFGFGDSCPIDDETAAAMLRPSVNGTLVGRFRVKQTILFDTLKLGQSEPKPGDNERRLKRSERVRKYLNEEEDCRTLETVWTLEAPSNDKKKQFCDLAHTMKAHGISTSETIIGPIRSTKFGLMKAISLQLSLTDNGRANVERFLLSRDADSFTVATGSLNFLRILSKNGGAPTTIVKFQYEIVSNVWAHIEKRLKKSTLRPKREIGEATFRKKSNHWQLVGQPLFEHNAAPLILPVRNGFVGPTPSLPIWSWKPQQ